MDIFFLQGLVGEFREVLSGLRLGRAFQLGATDLLLDFGLRDQRWLQVSTDPARLGCWLTRRGPRSRPEPARTETHFIELLRKHLDGLRLEEVEGLGYDRVVRFGFAGQAGSESGGEVRRDLVVWLTGRSANIFLMAGSRVIAELREREAVTEEYVDPPPPRDRLDPFTCSAERLRELIDEAEGDIVAAAQSSLLGFTPLLARELKARSAREAASGEAAMPETAWPGLIADLGGVAPTIFSDPPLEELRREPGRDEFQLTLSSLPLKQFDNLSKTIYPTLSEAADQYFSIIDDRRRLVGLRQRLSGILGGRQKRLGALLNNLDREAAKYRENEKWQRYGELLLANLHQAVETGTGSFLVVDFYDPGQELIEIPAAEKGTAREAAEHYFRQARKGRHALESIASRRPAAESEMATVLSDRARLAECRTLTELATLAERYGEGERVREAAAPRPAPTAKRPAEEVIPGVRRYLSSDGYQILVGRTDRDNDHLTMRVAKSFDLWFHAADYPGSHVVLRNPRRQPVPQRSIAEAAQLAAKFSQAKDLPKAAVNYCEKKFVTKPKGFAPGQVRLASFKTIMVEPAEAGERV